MKDSRTPDLEALFKNSPEMPESLSKQAITDKIAKKGIKPKAHEKKNGISWGFIAAIFAVLVISALIMQNNSGIKREGGNSPTVQEQTVQDNTQKPEPIIKAELPEGVYSFESREQVEEYFRYVSDKNYYFNISDDAVDFGQGEVVTYVATESFNESFSEAPTASGELKGNYTGTNTQNSADEGDIIKNDGRYIYVVSRINTASYVKIIDTESMKLLSSLCYDNADGVNLSNEIYVNGDTLIVLYNKFNNSVSTGVASGGAVYYDTFICGYGGNDETLADIYDISDRANPKKIRTVSQDGSLLSSRMIGTVLYTVTRYKEYPDADSEDYYCVPSVNGEETDCKSIIHFDESANTYTVITATDTADKESKTESLSVLCGSSGIYCSENNLYLLRNLYEDSCNKTAITKITLEGTQITCTANGEIEGTYDDKYSFDEYEGKLRAVTTNYDYSTYKNKCALYILDEKLEVISKIDDITDGLNEEVKSVRFVGEKAYVVTFRQTDPLFIIDLSDVNAPAVKGELFIPGYSTYLHPLSDSLLLGIGYGGDEENADMNKLKIALFDVSDMTKPSLVDEFVINNGYSDVNYEPKALIHYAAKNIIGIPVTIHSYNGYGNPVKSYAVITYAENKLSSVEGFVHSSESRSFYSSLFRGICIEEYLYTVDDLAVIEHGLSDGEKKRECVLATEQELEWDYSVEDFKVTTTVATSSAYVPEQ